MISILWYEDNKSLKLIFAILLLGCGLTLIAQLRFQKKPPWALSLLGLFFCLQSSHTLGQLWQQAQGSPQPVGVSEKPWYEGGTLNKASLKAWLESSDYADQRASAYQLLTELNAQRKITLYIRSIHDYKPWAAALVNCIQEQAQNAQQKEQPVQKAALFCSQRLKDYR